MEEMLKLVESQLYKSELTFSFLKERLEAAGEIRAWYRWYRGGNQWANKFFAEENIFLMNKVIIWTRISEDGQMGIHTFKLDEIAKVDREYVFPDKKNHEQLLLSQVLITFNAMQEKNKRDDLLLKRPKPEENGDVEGFLNFSRLLEV